LIVDVKALPFVGKKRPPISFRTGKSQISSVCRKKKYLRFRVWAGTNYWQGFPVNRNSRRLADRERVSPARQDRIYDRHTKRERVKPMDMPKEFATTTNGATNSSKPADESNEAVRGRAVFAIEMSGAGLVVKTAFLTEQNRVIEMPAVFPDLQYALAQIDSLRQIVIDRFAQAAQVGIQVMAAQAASGNVPQEPATQPAMAGTAQASVTPAAPLASAARPTAPIAASTPTPPTTTAAPSASTSSTAASAAASTTTPPREPSSRLV
jgi:hypothetical protein